MRSGGGGGGCACVNQGRRSRRKRGKIPRDCKRNNETRETWEGGDY